MSLPRKVTMVEVGPRDGLQNETQNVPTAVKLELIERLADAGMPVIQATAFVSPKWVPQMADHTQIMNGIRRRPGVRYQALVPNRKGLDAARAAGCNEIVVFGAATETFSKKNTNCTIDEGLVRFQEVCAEALKHGLKVRGDISVCLGCPYEGEVEPAQVARVARALYAMGCQEIALADTIGTGTPGKVRAVVETVAQHVPIEKIAGHFHDTYGQALANTYAALECGVAICDSSVAGLGGCPYAQGAVGNVASEDVLYMLDGLGIETGVNMKKLIAVGEFICKYLGHGTSSRTARALTAKHGAA
jgi:isopropylmalate/homocitrate/citramalate synthase